MNYWYLDDKGVYRKDNLGGVSEGNMEPIRNTRTGKLDPVPPGGFRFDPEEMRRLIREKRIHFHTDGSLPVLKRYLLEYSRQRPKGIMSDDQRPDYNLLKSMGLEFDNPKQLAFMRRIISIFGPNAVILDFFGGSGSTGHAAMSLNAEDDGTRQVITVTNDENGIATKVCYPRLRNVIRGWKSHTNSRRNSGLGGSLAYFRTDFAGEHNVTSANDRDRISLAHEACDMLALAENAFTPVYSNRFFRLYQGRDRHMAVYFREELDGFDGFLRKVERIEAPVSVYVFSWGGDDVAQEFEHLANVSVKPIPQPILDIYRRIYNL